MYRFKTQPADLFQLQLSTPEGSRMQPYFELFNSDGDRYFNGPRTGASGGV